MTEQSFALTSQSVLSGLLSNKPRSIQETTTDLTEQNGDAIWINVEDISESSIQPRKYFDPHKVEELANAFKNQDGQADKELFRGTINVRPKPESGYELVAGERRWRAAKQAGLQQVRCIVAEMTDEVALEYALAENVLREDLSKLEETEGILSLISQKLGISVEAVIKIIRTEGHSDKSSRSDVAPSEEFTKIEEILDFFGIGLQTFRTKNLRTLTLPKDLKQAHLEGKLPYSSAIELSKIKDEKARQQLLKKVLKDNDNPLPFRVIKDLVGKCQEKLKGKKTSSQWNLKTDDASQRIKNLSKRIKTAKIDDNPEKHQKVTTLLETLEESLAQVEEGLSKILDG